MAATVLEEKKSALPVDRQSQKHWAGIPIAARLIVLRNARHELARAADALVDAFAPALLRTRADSYAAEVMPLLSACKFLEREAQQILKPQRLGRRGLPFWLAGVDSTVEHAPFGVVLVIAPSNYPLFLAGVQTLQALAAGNMVIWKPGSGGWPVANLFRQAMLRAGLPKDVLRITDESVESAIVEMEALPDKIIFTGSAHAGREVLRLAAEHAIPVVAELSGCDAVVVLESADVQRVVEALAFGMRLNGSATCMAPRRLFVVGRGHESLLTRLQDRFAAMDGVEIDSKTRRQLCELVDDAERQGATICGNAGVLSLKPVLVLNGKPEMEIAQADVFAPVLTVLAVMTPDDVVRLDALCPFGLTVAVFGNEHEALELGKQLNVGTVVVNDLIVPTADPRVPFGGRRGSGFGTTRGAEGLLEMTAAKVVQVRKGRNARHYQATTAAHEELFRGAVAMSHGATWRERFAGLHKLAAAARKLK